MEKKSKIYFNCEICEKSFSSKQNKTKHVSIVHGEEKQFVCNLCSSSFGFKHDLTKHVENNHQGGQYSCNNCALPDLKVG